jgi:hypothetical protein
MIENPSENLSHPASWRGFALLRRWLIRIVFVLLGLPLVLAFVGASYQAIASGIANLRYPPPGQLVEVGGYKLHLYCLGEGAPTVSSSQLTKAPSPIGFGFRLN